MKKILLVALTAFAFASCQQKTEGTSTGTDSTAVVSETTDTIKLHQGGPVLNFETESYNFGKIKQGEIVTYAFKFKNTGRIPLIIKDAIATCGCTVPEPPKEPIQPGASSEIKVVFNSTGKTPGETKKPITVSSNALNNPVQLLLVGEILAK